MNDLVNQGGAVAPAGSLMTLVKHNPKVLDIPTVRSLTDPKMASCEEVADWRADNCKRVRKQHKRMELCRRLELPSFFGVLYISKHDAYENRWLDFGLASLRVVTNNGVGFIVDAFQNIVELENMKFHGIGTGGTAEAAADAALVTELTTQLNPDSLRGTGTTAETATNIYQTVATNTVDAAVAVTEHGIFSQAATGGGVLLDRSLFASVNLASGDSIQTDYRLTLTSGS